MEWSAQTMLELSVNRNYVGEYQIYGTSKKIMSHKKPTFIKRLAMRIFFGLKWIDYNNKK